MNHDLPSPIHRPDEPDGDLERLLVRNTFRTPPPDWRGLILEKALSGQTVEEPTGDMDPVFSGRELAMGSAGGGERIEGAVGRTGTRPIGLWTRILERLGSGWTVAAAAWALILGLNQYSVPQGERTPAPKAPWSDRALAEIQAHQRLVADISEGGAFRGPVSRSGAEQERDLRRPPVVRPRAGRETRETRYNV